MTYCIYFELWNYCVTSVLVSRIRLSTIVRHENKMMSGFWLSVLTRSDPQEPIVSWVSLIRIQFLSFEYTNLSLASDLRFSSESKPPYGNVLLRQKCSRIVYLVTRAGPLPNHSIIIESKKLQSRELPLSRIIQSLPMKNHKYKSESYILAL